MSIVPHRNYKKKKSRTVLHEQEENFASNISHYIHLKKTTKKKSVQ